MKKVILALIIGLCLTSVYGCNNKSDPFTDITQADVDAYINALPQLAQLKKAGENTEKVYSEIGKGDRIRGAYIVTKIGIAYAIVETPSHTDTILSQFDESMRPSQKELDLVAKNKDKFLKAMENIMGRP